MSFSCSEKPEQERSLLNLNKRSLDTSPQELRQPLAYVLHLCSLWKPKGRAKLMVPTSWMVGPCHFGAREPVMLSSMFLKEFLAIAGDGKSNPGVPCAVDKSCPFRNVRFESDAGTRLVGPDEMLPRDVVSQVLTNSWTDDRLATSVRRAFEGIPQTKLRSDVPVTSRFSQSTPRRIDFALAAGDGSDDAESVFSDPESSTSCLLLGAKEPTQSQHPYSASFDSRSGPHILAPIPEELTSHGQLHLARLAALMKRESIIEPESFPEWLVLFGILYNAHHVRIIAYVPRRLKLDSDVIDCATYIVDQLSLHPLITVDGARACELAFERLRFLVALTTLRRHVHHLSKSLFTTVGPPSDGVRRIDGRSAYDQQDSDNSESLSRCTSLGSSQHSSSEPEYLTCPSSVHVHELNEVPVLECREELSSSCRSFASSFCCICSSSLESASTSDSSHSEDSESRYTGSSYMEPSAISHLQGDDEDVPSSNKLSETKRRDIIAWTREVIPTEHPVKDTYRMVIYRRHPRRRRLADSKSSTNK